MVLKTLLVVAVTLTKVDVVETEALLHAFCAERLVYLLSHVRMSLCYALDNFLLVVSLRSGQ